MMQPQPIYSPYYYNNITSSGLSLKEACLHGLDMDIYMSNCEFSSSITTTDDSSDDSSIFFLPTMNPDDEFFLPNLPLLNVPDFPFEFPLGQEYLPNYMEELSPFPNQNILTDDEVENVFGLMEDSEIGLLSRNLTDGDNEGSLKSSIMICSETSPDITSDHSLLVLPSEDMEIDNQLSLPHLLKAYSQAMENEQAELAEAISRCVKEKVGPAGPIVERLAYYLLQALDSQGDYLRQESSKNYEAAFRAFYQIFPYGRFAHLTSNLAILEAMPLDTEMIHIVDFDMGEGIQWPPLMEAIGRRRAVRLTAVKRKEDCCVPSTFKLEETKRRLQEHSKSLGLMLEVEEMEMEELVSELMKIETNSRSKEWLVFNCMVGLPHMGRGRSRVQVTEFLKVAKFSIQKNRGIITFGDGEVVEERVGNWSGFGSFFEGHLNHFHALFESMDWHFPSHLTEARIAMECLFVAPYVSSLAWFGKWEEAKEGFGLQCGHGLECWRFSKGNLVQAKEMVGEGDSPYRASVEGENENVMVLEWKGTPLVKVSTWK